MAAMLRTRRQKAAEAAAAGGDEQVVALERENQRLRDLVSASLLLHPPCQCAANRGQHSGLQPCSRPCLLASRPRVSAVRWPTPAHLSLPAAPAAGGAG